jgi:hypothetical protein
MGGQAMHDVKTLTDLWNRVAGMDRTVGITPRQIPALQKKQICSCPYSRSAMFSAMAKREAAVFRGVPVDTQRHERLDPTDSLVHALSTKFPRRETSRVQVGPSAVQKRLPVREIMRRWQGKRAVVGVTDLHIRGTKLEEFIDTRTLSDFNLIIRGSDRLSEQEMLTLVIASPGNVTDSHSDDPDGTNHCFTGKKLWLAWETFEGIEAGMQDVERQSVYGAAKFSMAKFLSLKSSRWWLVTRGDTLFLPANLTHKVFTLEYYLGVGSFHVGLPGCLDNLSRWLYYGPLWSLDDPMGENKDLVDEIVAICLRTAKRTAAASHRSHERWGYSQMLDGYRHWLANTKSHIRNEVLRHDDFRQLVDEARMAA